MPTVPTATTIARSRATSAARFTGSLLGVSAVISTASTPEPADCCKSRVAKLGRRGPGSIRTQPNSKFGAIGRNVKPENAAPGGLQHLHRELPEQAEADHRDDIAEFHLGGANSVQGDRPNGRESGLIERHRTPSGNLRNQQSRNTCEFGVHCVTSARASTRSPTAISVTPSPTPITVPALL